MIILFLTCAAGAASAATFPGYINYQGKLGDPSGNPLTGQYSFAFRLYNAEVGGTLLATDANYTGASKAVNVVNGLYSVQIGSWVAGGLPESVFHQAEFWLELDVNLGTSLVGAETLAPRERLAAAPFSFRAINAEKLGTGMTVATFTAAGNLTLPYGVTAATASFTNNSGFAVTTSSGISVGGGGGVYAAFFSGDGSGLTGISPGESNTYASSKTFTGNVLIASSMSITGAAGLVTTYGITAGSFTTTGPLGYITSASSITASAFFGYGGNLTGLPSSEANTYTSSKTFTNAMEALGITNRGQETIVSTLTVQGNAFSVGTSSFTVAGGSATVGYSMTAASFIGNGALLTGIPSTAAYVAADALKVTKAGDGMTGNLTMLNGSTITITGNAFSVGTTSFTVAGGSATVGYSLTAGSLITNGPMGFITSASSITASAFFGYGGNLTGLPSSEANTYASSKTFTSASGITAIVAAFGTGPTALSTFTSTGNLQMVRGSPITSNGTISFSTAPSAAQTTVPNLFISGNGNVAIGTTTANALLDVAGGVRINTTTTKPTCDATQRGTAWVQQGGAGVADLMFFCLKKSDDLYKWVQLGIGD